MRTSNEMQKRGIKQPMKQLQRRFMYLFGSKAKEAEGFENSKEGCFTIFVRGKGELEKYRVELRYLRYPPFVKLLEAAEQEFGFDQPGVLVIPCEASELQRILSLKQVGDKDWGLPKWLEFVSL